MKIVTVVGARPQFIKAAPVSRALREAGLDEFLVHTGQHYDYAMSQVFFDELGLDTPDLDLNVGSGSHGRQTGQMLADLEDVMRVQAPDWVIVYGDTNSTLAGALAAVKLQIPVAHIEAGLRSFNRAMPEEHNRVLTDHCSDLLCCPTQTAVDNLAREGIARGVHLVGDPMYDAVLHFAARARLNSTILRDLGLTPKGYVLATVHRPYNTDQPGNLRSILRALADLDERVVFPVHPRTRQKLAELDGFFLTASVGANVCLTEPVGYLDMLCLEENARVILTDSGGVQKEAYFLQVPCVTLRPETEWVETVAAGWNVVVGTDRERIVEVVRKGRWPSNTSAGAFGDGQAGKRIAALFG